MTDPVTPEKARRLAEEDRGEAAEYRDIGIRLSFVRYMERNADALDSLAAQLEAAQKRERVLRDNLGAAPHPNLVSHPVYTVWYESSRDALAQDSQTHGGSDDACS